MLQIQKTKTFLIVLLLALSASVIYNSWPLGFWLNPVVGLRGTASELEAFHEPYSWLFISLDIISGLLVIMMVRLLWRQSHDRRRKAALICLELFGVFTILAALIPLNCDPSVSACSALSDYPLLIAHGLATIAGGLSLFMSAAVIWYCKRQQAGATLMSILMVGWAAAGLLAVYFFFVPGPDNLTQHYYIALCGLWLILLPLMLGTQPLYSRVPLSRRVDLRRKSPR